MPYTTDPSESAIELRIVDETGLGDWLEQASETQRRWVEASSFKGQQGRTLQVPDADGGPGTILVGQDPDSVLYQLADLSANLPRGHYRIGGDQPAEERRQMALGWGLGAYVFDRYKENQRPIPELVVDEEEAESLRHLLAAQSLVRDLVNTPTEDMGPAQLATVVEDLAAEFDARFSAVVGDDLLDENYPAIHAVGRAASADRAPRLIRLDWGDDDHPHVTLVGKGVCFDTGGLNLKPARGMLLMKKDMGGAAHVIGLARMIMACGLPVRLTLLIPAVENSVSGSAYRPGDVIHTRKGLTVEIGNTDAEGRVVLSDALTLAAEEEAELIVDMATLTGAARVALGTDLPPIFGNHEDLAREVEKASMRVEDPVWTMPLWPGYRKLLSSPIADLNNISNGPYGGCITAALFLQHFVPDEIPWLHIDTFAWNQDNRPGRPKGGEALGLRAMWAWLEERYGRGAES